MQRPDQLRIFMHPQYLVLARMASGNILAKSTIACPIQSDETGASNTEADQPWSAAVAALGAMLQSPQWQGAAAQLVLSNHLVRYALIPWHADLAGHAERQAFLRHSFLLHYGDVASSWDLRMSDAGIQQNSLASGMEQGLLHEIQHAFTHAGVMLEAVYPHLMVAVNHSRPYLTDDCWLAVVESGRVCVALLHNRQWLSVKSFALAADDERGIGQGQIQIDVTQTLSAFLQREAILCAVDAAHWPLVVYWPGCKHKTSLQSLERPVVWAMPVAVDNAIRKVSSRRIASALSTIALHKADADYDAVLWA